MRAIFTSSGGPGVTCSRSSGTTGSACRFTPSGWSAAGSSGRRRPTVWSRSLRRSWPTCLTGSIGGTRFSPGGRKSPAEACCWLLRGCGFLTHPRVERGGALGDVSVSTPMPLPTDLAEAHVLILRQREELAAAAARASGAEALIAHMKLVIAKLRREQYGQSSERGRKVLDQLELQLEELEAETSENAVTAEDKAAGVAVKSFARQRPVRAPLPAHLPRERVGSPAPCACPVCGGTLAKLGEDITETLEIVPRQWKVIQTVREKFICRSC